MEHLITYLNQTPVGPIREKSQLAQLEKLLAECWDDFTGDYGGMKGYKLLERMEDVWWDPPILSFTIERHGATKLGSTRAELQNWTVDIEQKVVTQGISNYRLITKRAAPLDVNSIAEDVVKLVLNHADDERLKWSKKGNVQVLISRILPKDSAFKRTLEGRRRRLSEAIRKKLAEHGWYLLGNSWYEPPQVRD